MTSNAMFEKRQPALEPVDEAVDHVRGPAVAPLILEYADCECPYSRRAFRKIELVEKEIGGGVRFAFRHFPLTQIHPHAFAAAAGKKHSPDPHRRRALTPKTAGSAHRSRGPPGMRPPIAPAHRRSRPVSLPRGSGRP